MPDLVISIHDVAPASLGAGQEWARRLAHLPVPLTFLVIPGPWRGRTFAADGAELGSWLRRRQAQGDEVSLHGWCHRADVPGAWPRRVTGALVARGAAEFWALDRRESAARTAQGLELLEADGLVVDGVTPPGWLASREAVEGMAGCGVRYVTDHAGLRDLVTGRRWWAPAVCNRPAAADAGASVTESGGRWLLGQAWRLTAARRPVRIGLHPDDLLRPGLAASSVRAIERCLDAGARVTTYRQVGRRVAVRSAGTANGART